jgi:hypothetical protein
MTRALASLLTLVACASQVPTHESFQGVGEPVPQNVLDDVLPDVIADLRNTVQGIGETVDTADRDHVRLLADRLAAEGFAIG